MIAIATAPVEWPIAAWSVPAGARAVSGPGDRTPNPTRDGMSPDQTSTPELQACKDARRELSLKLAAMRLKAGLTQKQIAARMGKDQAFVSRMEQSTEPMPKAQSIALYAQACDVHVAYAFLEADTDDGFTLTGLAPVDQPAEPARAIAGIEDVRLSAQG